MYAFIKGILVQKNPTFVILETHGIGYHINISLNTYTKIQNETAEVKLFLHQQVMEDAHVFYGFAEEAEKQLFQQLISVSGVGCTSARMILSSMAPADLQNAIVMENEKLLEKVKGIGPKTAKRMILELKDKMMKTIDSKAVSGNNWQHNNIQTEALSALMALGFSKAQAENGVLKIIKSNPSLNTVEALIKEALKAM